MPIVQTSNITKARVDHAKRVNLWNKLVGFDKDTLKNAAADITDAENTAFAETIYYTLRNQDPEFKKMFDEKNIQFNKESAKYLLDKLSITKGNEKVSYSQYSFVQPDLDDPQSIKGLLAHIAINLTDGPLAGLEPDDPQLSYTNIVDGKENVIQVKPVDFDITKVSRADREPVLSEQYKNANKAEKKIEEQVNNKIEEPVKSNVEAKVEKKAVEPKHAAAEYPGIWVHIKSVFARMLGMKDSESVRRMDAYNSAKEINEINADKSAAKAEMKKWDKKYDKLMEDINIIKSQGHAENDIDRMAAVASISTMGNKLKSLEKELGDMGNDFSRQMQLTKIKNELKDLRETYKEDRLTTGAIKSTSIKNMMKKNGFKTKNKTTGSRTTSVSSELNKAFILDK